MGTLNYGRGGTVGTAQYVGRTKWARAYYDFATDGGALGAINLRGDMIPAGARVLSAHIDVATAVVNGAGTVSIGVEGAADIRAAAVVGTAPALNAVATPVSALLNRSTAAVRTTVDRHIVATLATAAVTAGRFSVLVEYVELHSAV